MELQEFVGRRACFLTKLKIIFQPCGITQGLGKFTDSRGVLQQLACPGWMALDKDAHVNKIRVGPLKNAFNFLLWLGCRLGN